LKFWCLPTFSLLADDGKKKEKESRIIIANINACPQTLLRSLRRLACALLLARSRLATINALGSPQVQSVKTNGKIFRLSKIIIAQARGTASSPLIELRTIDETRYFSRRGKKHTIRQDAAHQSVVRERGRQQRLTHTHPSEEGSTKTDSYEFNQQPLLFVQGCAWRRASAFLSAKLVGRLTSP
jgi:hypothetical protein